MSWVDDVLAVAEGEVGVTEWPKGSNCVKYNEWYYGRSVSGAAYPWCMAFVQWDFDRAGHTLPHKTASCSNLLNWYRSNKPECVRDKPAPGAIAIYNFGHTGIVARDNGDGTVAAIEGNTSATEAGSQSNGGGVFKVRRPAALVTKYIIPFEIEEEDMSGEEIYNKLNEFLAGRPAPDWAEAELREAVDMGITDGTNPMQLMPRYQAAIMAKRAVEIGKKGAPAQS